MEWGFDRRFALGALAISIVIALAGVAITILWAEAKAIGWLLLFLAAAIFSAWVSFEIFQWIDRRLVAIVLAVLSTVAVLGALFFIHLRYGRKVTPIAAEIKEHRAAGTTGATAAPTAGILSPSTTLNQMRKG
jgi:hypothetical protein